MHCRSDLPSARRSRSCCASRVRCDPHISRLLVTASRRPHRRHRRRNVAHHTALLHECLCRQHLSALHLSICHTDVDVAPLVWMKRKSTPAATQLCLRPKFRIQDLRQLLLKTLLESVGSAPQQQAPLPTASLAPAEVRNVIDGGHTARSAWKKAKIVQDIRPN